MLLDGKSVVSETTLERMLVAEGITDPSVMGTEIDSTELRVSDVVAESGVTNGKSVVCVTTSVGR